MTDRTATPDLATATPLDLDAIERRLRAEFSRNEQQLVELEGVLTEMVRAHDTIQEDEDDMRRIVDAVRGDLHRARRALERLERGSYGRCLSCGSAIRSDRLEVIPTAEHCNACA